jgi:hypothetical protein
MDPLATIEALAVPVCNGVCYVTWPNHWKHHHWLRLISPPSLWVVTLEAIFLWPQQERETNWSNKFRNENENRLLLPELETLDPW